MILGQIFAYKYNWTMWQPDNSTQEMLLTLIKYDQITKLWECINQSNQTFNQINEANQIKKGITDDFSTTYCCPLLTIYPRCCPRYAPDMPQMMLLPTADIIQRLPLDGVIIGTFEYCHVFSARTTVVFWGKINHC